jgi:hypothetical protein
LAASNPELVTAILPAPKVLAKPSAIWERQEFFLQANITFFMILTPRN